MPTVPRLEPGRVQEAALPGVRVSVNAPDEAFGTGASTEKFNRAAQGLTGQAMEMLEAEKRKADDTATQDAYAKAVREKNRLMYSTDKEDPGVMMKRGKDAFGVTDEYGSKYKKFNDDLEASLKNRTQVDMFRKIRLSQETDFNDSLQRHTFTEAKAYKEQTFKSGVAAAQENAWQNFQKPGVIQQSLSDQRALILSNAQDNGLPKEAVDLLLKESTSKTSAGVIHRMLVNGMVADADAAFKVASPMMLDDDRKGVEAMLDSKKTLTESVATWNKVAGFKLADGTADLDKMQNAIFAMKGVPQEKKEKYWDYTKSRANEEDQQAKDKLGAQTHAFTNEVLTARKKGLTLTRVKDEIINKYGGDPVRQKDLNDIATKLYTTDIKTNPATYYAVWEQIKNGNPDGQKLVQKAFNEQELSGSDYQELLKLTYDTKHKEDEYMKAQVVDSLKEVAKEEFGNSRSGKQEQSNYLYSVLIRSRGKSPEETQKIGQDMFKNKVTKPGWLWDSKEATYKLEKQAIESNFAAVGVMHQKIGETMTNIIGGPNNIDKFLEQTGVSYDQLKKGTPQANAIESLKKHGRAITKKNINAVLSTYKDGVIR